MNATKSPARGLNKADIRRRFDRVAGAFGDADFVHRRSFVGLLERLQPMQLKPKRILDLGAAEGAGSRVLAKHYRGSRVLSLDLSGGMLAVGRRKRSRFARIRELQADAAAIPLASGSIDLIVANQLLPWIDQPERVFAELRRVLRKEGLLAFATLGPDSFLEFRDIWRQEDDFSHVNDFADMHNIGDAVVRSGLSDPVLDVELLNVTYRDPKKLFRDLHRAGSGNALLGRRPTLTGKARLQRVAAALAGPASSEPISIGLELVFGHAWGTGPPAEPGEFRVDPATIGRIQR